MTSPTSPTEELQAASGLESAAEPPGERIRFPALDGLRGLAALAVVSTHVGFQTGRTARPGPAASILSRGDFGVTVFFLLSGFLLYRPLANGMRRSTTSTYLRRRALRVLPAYWVAVVAAFVLLPLNRGGTAGEWVKHLVLVQIYFDKPLPAGLTQMWSLCTEVAFYITMPLYALAVARRRRRRGEAIGSRTDAVALGFLVVVGWAWTAAAAGPHLPSSAHLWLPAYVDWFALGMGLAVMHHRVTRGEQDGLSVAVRDLARAPGTCLSIGALLLLLACTPLAGPKLLLPPTTWEALVKHVLYGLSAFWLLLPAVFARPGGTAWTRFLGSKPLHLVGLVSYSVFALHLVVLDFVFRALDIHVFTGHFGTVWLVTVAASLAVAAVSYRLVERPALQWGHRSGAHSRRV
ncbi:MAG: acyltransferase [Mycobacteriales bacterium]